MGMAELEKAITAVRGSDQSRSKGPQDPGLVAAAEGVLGISFPPTYRRFVSELGFCGLPGDEVYGVIDGDFTHSAVPDGVWCTLQQRETAALPNYLVIVASTGMGEWYVLDTSERDEYGECPVAVWSSWYSENGGIEEVVAPDFGSFFWDRVLTAFGPEH